MSAVTFKVHGLRELDAGFKSLADDFDASKATVKNTMRAGMKDALQPMADRANQLAPNDPETPGGLSQSYHVGTQLTPRQKRLAKKEPKDFATVYMGTTDPAGVPQEFGTVNHPAQPHIRPAFAQEARATIDRLAQTLRARLDKAIARARRKTLKKAS